MDSSSIILPDDVIIEILSRLPVKSIIRFRCVCKTWCSLTRNPRFISKHIQNSPNNENVLAWNHENECRILAKKIFFGGILDLLPLDDHFMNLPDVIKELVGEKLDTVSLCDGVFCLYWVESGIIALWNPATRDFRVLPISQSEYPPYKVSTSVVGFGFDPETADYKVVKLVYFDTERINDPEISCAEVYSLSTDSWRMLHHSIDDMSAFQSIFVKNVRSVSVHINGVLHWGFHEKDGDRDCNPQTILSFDMRNEEFRVTPFPNNYNKIWYEKRSTLSLLHGQLAILCWVFDYELMGVGSFDVWLMNAYGGAQDCWSHVFSVTPPFRGFTSPVCFWNTDELVCVKDGPLMSSSEGDPLLYDPVTDMTRELKLSGEENFIYKESLVSVKSVIGEELQGFIR